MAEMNGTGVKNIPLSQAPAQLRNAMNGDLLEGMAASHYGVRFRKGMLAQPIS